ncbi:MAG: hypothetical protein ACYDAD_02995 [Acidimicrobiales bacterium]
MVGRALSRGRLAHWLTFDLLRAKREDLTNGTVPSGYPAYVRICHPAPDRDDKSATWSEVAQVTGRQAHPLMQWHALVGSPDSLNMHSSLWPGDNPERGNLVPEVLGPLCDLLADHTATAERCLFCVWEGYASLPELGVAAFAADDPIPMFSLEELNRTRVGLPDRDYLLLTGPLHLAPKIGWRQSSDWFIPQSPNLFWPADRAWCVATEIDFDSTLVGGTTDLVDAILQAPRLDSWAVQPEDPLAADADRINLVHQRILPLAINLGSVTTNVQLVLSGLDLADGGFTLHHVAYLRSGAAQPLDQWANASRSTLRNVAHLSSRLAPGPPSEPTTPTQVMKFSEWDDWEWRATDDRGGHYRSNTGSGRSSRPHRIHYLERTFTPALDPETTAVTFIASQRRPGGDTLSPSDSEELFRVEVSVPPG